MRLFSRVAFVLVVSSFVACSQTTPVQPDSLTSANGASGAGGNAAPPGTGKPEIDPTWANGELVYMIGPHGIPNARETMPNLYAQAEELYLVVFPQLPPPPSPGAGPITLPSHYEPQCNPCFHPGLPAPFVYHDHVITGAPGMGRNGTAGEYKAPWKIIIVMYDRNYALSPNFHPLTSVEDIDAAENPQKHILQQFSSGPNPYEVDTGNLLICPTVSKHA